jgi:hypothetical protein
MLQSGEEGCQQAGSSAAPASGYAAPAIGRAGAVPAARRSCCGGGSAAHGERMRCLRGPRQGAPAVEVAGLPAASACAAYGDHGEVPLRWRRQHYP